MLRIYIYTSSIQYEDELLDSLSHEGILGLYDVTAYTLSEFVEACNKEEVSLSTVYVKLREYEEKSKDCAEILVITADHEVYMTAIAIRQDTMQQVWKNNDLPIPMDDESWEEISENIRIEVGKVVSGEFHIEWYTC